MTPEGQARQTIDRQLEACGWIVQDRKRMSIYAGQGVAVREFPLDDGEADYLLYAEGKVIGVVEAKPQDHGTLTGVESQSARYVKSLPAGVSDEDTTRPPQTPDCFGMAPVPEPSQGMNSADCPSSDSSRRVPLCIRTATSQRIDAALDRISSTAQAPAIRGSASSPGPSSCSAPPTSPTGCAARTCRGSGWTRPA
jgi:type I site-specific restriction endonuclease